MLTSYCRYIKMQNKKFFFTIISVILAFVCINIHLNIGITNYDIQTISLLGIIIISYVYISWKFLYYRILSPYIVFVTCLYLCLCGQSVMWAFGLEAGWRDLRQNTYWDFNDRKFEESLLYSYLCILILHITVIQNIENSKHFKKLKLFNRFQGYNLTKHLDLVGWFLVIISIGPYLYISFLQLSTIAIFGYDAQYTITGHSGLSQFSEYIGAGLLILLYGAIEKRPCISKYLTYIISCLYLLMETQLGQRTPLILFALAIIFVLYKNKTINTKRIVFCGACVIISMISMRLIVLYREGSILNANDVIKYLGTAEQSPAVDFLGDIGWNIFSLGYCQQLIPDRFDYNYGMSYIMSLTSIIPNIGIWTVHPAAKYGMLGSWLQKVLDVSFGVGFTPVAESYYNFGWFGCFVFIFWGFFCVFMNRLFEDKKNTVSYLFLVLIVGVVFKSAVRSSFLAFFKPLVFMCIIPILVLLFLSKKRNLGRE